MNILDQLKQSKDITAPDLEARWIMEHGVDPEAAVKRRLSGEPLAYILGEKEFYSLTFIVTPDVLIPRPESEHLVGQALAWQIKNQSPARVLDLGSGSGCIGLAIIKNTKGAQLVSVDHSPEAVAIAKQNAEALGLVERSKIFCHPVEKLETEGLADIIVANPPYISRTDSEIEVNVKKFEPDTALFADEGGYAAIKAWACRLNDFMAPKAVALFEIGSTQGPAAKEIFESLGIFDTVEILKDYSGHDRVIRAERTV